MNFSWDGDEECLQGMNSNKTYAHEISVCEEKRSLFRAMKYNNKQH